MGTWIGFTAESKELDEIKSPALRDELHVTYVYLTKRVLPEADVSFLHAFIQGLALTIPVYGFPVTNITDFAQGTCNVAEVNTNAFLKATLRPRVIGVFKGRGLPVDTWHDPWKPHVTLGYAADSYSYTMEELRERWPFVTPIARRIFLHANGMRYYFNL